MSGRPFTYSRGQAIAHLMQDHRRPIIKKLAEEKRLSPVYIYKDDLFVCWTSTAEWLPRLYKLTPQGRQENTSMWDGSDVAPIAGWPSEEEIAACIAASAEREKAGGGLAGARIRAAELAASEQLSVFRGFSGHFAHRFEERWRRRARGRDASNEHHVTHNESVTRFRTAALST
jgi:hypothetical protein